MKQPGVEVRPLRQMTGGADFNEVFLTDAKTPKDWIVGKRGEGWLVSRATLKHERNSIGAAAHVDRDVRGPRAPGEDDEARRQALRSRIRRSASGWRRSRATSARTSTRATGS